MRDLDRDWARLLRSSNPFPSPFAKPNSRARYAGGLLARGVEGGSRLRERGAENVRAGRWRGVLATRELVELELLDEEMTEAEMRDLEGAEIVCRKLLACKFEEMEECGGTAGVKVKLAEILGRSNDTD